MAKSSISRSITHNNKPFLVKRDEPVFSVAASDNLVKRCQDAQDERTRRIVAVELALVTEFELSSAEAACISIAFQAACAGVEVVR